MNEPKGVALTILYDCGIRFNVIMLEILGERINNTFLPEKDQVLISN